MGGTECRARISQWELGAIPSFPRPGWMGSLVWCLMEWLPSLPVAEACNGMVFEVPSKPNHCRILRSLQHVAV